MLAKINFILKSSKKHNNKYDYSLVDYVNSQTKIKILCPQHGIFLQIPNNHVRGSGCSQCVGNKKSDIRHFLKKANKKHDNKYDYSLAAYENNRSKMNIVCPKHGMFKQEASAHLKGQGCIQCFQENQKLTLEQFIQQAKKVHGKTTYDYSLVKYHNNKTKIKITCPKHGEFKQRPDMHVFDKNGCPQCFSRTSKGQEQLFNTVKQKYSKAIKEHKIVCENKIYFIDIYIPETNTIVEYYGDYWHCNPRLYSEGMVVKQNKKMAKTIWAKDKKRQDELEQLGYKVVVVWESDFKNKLSMWV